MAVIDDKKASYTTVGSAFVTIPGSTIRGRMSNTGAFSFTLNNSHATATAVVQVIASNDDPGAGVDLDPTLQTCVVVDETHPDGGGSSVTLAADNVPQAYGQDHPHFLYYAVQAKDGSGHGVIHVHGIVRS